MRWGLEGDIGQPPCITAMVRGCSSDGPDPLAIHSTALGILNFIEGI